MSTFVDGFRRAAGGVKSRLRRALETANVAVGEVAKQEARYAGMGCTLVACAVAGDDWRWISVGDSLLWMLDGDGLRRLNADHSMRPIFENLVRLGRVTPQEIADGGAVNQLRAAVTGGELTLIDERDPPRRLRSGDRIILGSDGLQTLSPDEMLRACDRNKQASSMVSETLRQVKAAGRSNQDNTTVIVYLHARAGSVRRRFVEFEVATRPQWRASRS